MADRGISPVVGVVLLVAITLLLASMFAVAVVQFGDLDDENEQVDDLLDEPDNSRNYPDSDLIPAKAPGDAPRTSGDEVLAFRIENTRDEPVTIAEFEIDASGIDPGIVIDDGNADEVDVQRGDQTGKANREGSPDEFTADGTRYHFVDDSDDGQVAVLDANQDDAEIDVRKFSEDVGELEFTNSESSADLAIYLVLDDGSRHGLYLRRR